MYIEKPHKKLPFESISNVSPEVINDDLGLNYNLNFIKQPLFNHCEQNSNDSTDAFLPIAFS